MMTHVMLLGNKTPHLVEHFTPEYFGNKTLIPREENNDPMRLLQ